MRNLHALFLSAVFLICPLLSQAQTQFHIKPEAFRNSKAEGASILKMVQNLHELYGMKIQKKFKKSVEYYVLPSNGMLEAYVDPFSSEDYIELFMRVPKSLSKPTVLAVLCHELGHLISGGRKMNWVNVKETTAVEGQSDYFVASCMKTYMHKFDSTEDLLLLTTADEDVVKTCEQKKKKVSDEQCLVILQSFKEIFTFMREDVNYEYIYKEKARTTSRHHPEAQCRLSTVKNAVLGKGRPRCWYHPLIPVAPSLIDYDFIRDWYIRAQYGY